MVAATTTPVTPPTTQPSTASNSIYKGTTFGRISTEATSNTSKASAISLPLTTLIPIIVALVVLLVLIAVMLALYYKRKKTLKKPYSNTDQCTAEEPHTENGQVHYVNVHPNNNQEMIDNILFMSRASNQPEDENEQNPYNKLQHFTKFHIKEKNNDSGDQYSHIQLTNSAATTENDQQDVYNEIYVPKETVENENQFLTQNRIQREQIKKNEHVENTRRYHDYSKKNFKPTRAIKPAALPNDDSNIYSFPFN